MADVQGGSLKYGVAITIDGAHLKMQEKHYYDFKLLYMEIVDKRPFVDQGYQISNLTLLFAEGSDQPNVRNIKKCLNEALALKCKVSMDTFRVVSPWLLIMLPSWRELQAHLFRGTLTLQAKLC